MLAPATTARPAQVAQQYLKSVPGDKDMQLLVANAVFQQKDYKGAIAAADRIMKGGGTPSQDLLQLVLRSNYELNDSAGTARALEQLLKYYPSRRHLGARARRLPQADQARPRTDGAVSSRGGRRARSSRRGQYTDMTQALVIGGFGQEAERVMQKGIDARTCSRATT